MVSTARGTARGCVLSVKHKQNDKSSKSWFGPFAIGLVAGVLLTLSVGEWLREQAEESATVAHAALEADSTRYTARAPEPPPSLPARAAEPAVQEQPQPTAAEPAQPGQVAAAPAAAPAPAETPAPKPTAAPPAAAKPPAAQEHVATAARAPLPAAAQPAPPPPAAVQAQPAPPPPPVHQDPNSEEAKLAAAAQVRVKGDTQDRLDARPSADWRQESRRGARRARSSYICRRRLARDDVVNTMSVIVPAIRGCAQGQSGLGADVHRGLE